MEPGLVTLDRSHAPAIREILNHAIVHSTALYDYEPRTEDAMQAWFDGKERQGFPVIGILGPSGEVLAFGSYGSFRAWPAYKYTVEHSLYVEQGHRGRGFGRRVLDGLVELAQQQDLHCMVGGIDAENRASIRLHEARGFVACGLIRQVGFKFGRWLDLALYQRLLPTPGQPIDG